MLSERFERALLLACRLHASQYRKLSDVPYVAHLLAVASLVLEHGGSEDEAIAALLHDAVEDQGGAATRAVILTEFGPEVTAIIDGCTDTDQEPKPPWRARKEQHVAHVAAASPSVRLVVAADKLHNVRSLTNELRTHGASVWQHFKGSHEGTLWYNREMLSALRKDGANALVEELARAIEELERVVRETAS